MTTEIQANPTTPPPRSRRALLASALGGLGAVAAGMLTRRAPANAAEDGDPLLIGVVNEAPGETRLERFAENGAALFVSNGNVGLDAYGGITGVRGRSNAETGVMGSTHHGIGVQGSAVSGYAGFFRGKIYASSFIELEERSTPARPLANRARLFVRDNGDNHTQLCVKFPNGAVRVLATA